MKTWTKVLLITIIFGLISFFLSRVLWTPNKDIMPTSGQLPFFIVLSILNSIVFGLGISFIIFGWSSVKNLLGNSALSLLSYLSLAWLLVSWWPHDNFHMQVGLDLQGLLYIEYGFHVTLILSSLIITYAFVKSTKSNNLLKN